MFRLRLQEKEVAQRIARIMMIACMCVCLCVCAHTNMHLCVCVCTCMCVSACMYASVYVCMPVCLHIHTCTCMCVCCMCVCLCPGEKSLYKPRTGHKGTYEKLRDINVSGKSQGHLFITSTIFEGSTVTSWCPGPHCQVTNDSGDCPSPLWMRL